MSRQSGSSGTVNAAGSVVIIGHAGDSHTVAVRDELARRGQRVRVLDTATFLREQHASLAAPAVAQIEDFSDVKSVWLRRPRPLAELSGKTPELTQGARVEFLECLWTSLQGSFWVNAQPADRAARLKPYQLAIAKSVGLDIPATLVTNDESEAAAFLSDLGGRGIYKSMTREVRRSGTVREGLYAVPVSTTTIAGLGLGIRMGPCLFQERLDKSSELRITIMGRSMFAHESYPGRHDGSVVDWRSMVRSMRHVAAEIPQWLSDRLAELMTRLGLVMACIDVAKTSDNRLVFLEANPNGQWLWSQELTGQPLMDRFADLLIRGAA